MEATRSTSVISQGNPEQIYNMDPAYQVGYTQQEVEGKKLVVTCFINFNS